VKGVNDMRQSRQWFFYFMSNSPILRIAVTVVASIAAACGDKSPTAPSGPPAPASTIVYTAVGARDALGIGASIECGFLADCPNGTGYVPLTVRQLRAQSFTVTYTNLGIPTAVIGRDFQTLGQQYGRFIAGNFIEQEMPFVLPNATLVTVFAGINEVNTVTAALGAGAGGADPNGYMDAQIRAFATDYTTLVNGIKARASAARVIVLNVPNAAGLPYLAGAPLAQRQAAQRIAVGMTRTGVNALTTQNVTVVDLMCDARSYVPSNYSADGLHPNDAGYAFIAGEVVKAATTTSYPAPRASCSSMTIVP
jgi:lysophospholipase L1-like esterase